MTDLNRIPNNEKIALTQIYEEYLAAKKKYPPFNSPHEAYGVILEELEETWHLIKNDEKAWAGRDAMKYEIKAVGAMALRFMVDL
jgi:hypothetical protein